MSVIDIARALSLAIQIFAIMDPMGAIPALLDALEDRDDAEKRRLINTASIAIFILLTVFPLFGNLILSIFGISIPSLKIAAGVVLMAIAIDILITGHKPREISTGEYVIVPIATPLIVGPGTMTLLITSARIYGVVNTLLAAYIAFVMTYVVLRTSTIIVKLVGETFIHGLGRFMSIIIASLAVELLIGGVREIF